MKHSRYVLAALAFTIFLSGCALSRSPITGTKRLYGYSWEQEVQLGREADQQIIAQMGVYEDPQLQECVNDVAQRVLAQSHLRRPDAQAEFRNTPFTFRILDSPVVNAFALPGGYVYVTRGLLNHLADEAQLAVVLGHEIGHVAARHASQRAAEQQLGQLGLIGGAILGQAVLGGNAAQNILNLGSQATQLLFLSYGREDERESDDLGAEYAALSGYEIGQAAEFFNTLERLGAREGGGLPNWLSTHPDPGEREVTLRELDAYWEQRAQLSIVDREEYLRCLEGTVVGENPRQGFVENNTFFHPELRFRFPVPQGFQVVNQYTQVVLVGPNQQAVQYFQIVDAASPQAAASQLAQQIQVAESGQTRVNGLPAYVVTGQAQLEGGQTVGVVGYFVQYNGRVYSFVGMTPADLFGTYRNAFLQAAQGFAPLTDPSILNVQPARINVVAAPRTAPFRAFVPQNLPRGMTPEELAILNQASLDDVIPQGTLLKLPG